MTQSDILAIGVFSLSWNVRFMKQVFSLLMNDQVVSRPQ